MTLIVVDQLLQLLFIETVTQSKILDWFWKRKLQ